MTKVFCCTTLESLVQERSSPLKYIPYLRQFTLTIPKQYLKKNELCMNFTISHCPYCGSKLPSRLAEQWDEIVEKEFGIAGFVDEDAARLIPDEFKTDEWWKKRGL